jgi:hypothetical protein
MIGEIAELGTDHKPEKAVCDSSLFSFDGSDKVVLPIIADGGGGRLSDLEGLPGLPHVKVADSALDFHNIHYTIIANSFLKDGPLSAGHSRFVLCSFAIPTPPT